MCCVCVEGLIIAQGQLVLPLNGTMPFLGSDISPLEVQMDNMDRAILRVKIGAPGRWEVPQAKLFNNTIRGV